MRSCRPGHGLWVGTMSHPATALFEVWEPAVGGVRGRCVAWVAACDRHTVDARRRAVTFGPIVGRVPGGLGMPCGTVWTAATEQASANVWRLDLSCPCGAKTRGEPRRMGCLACWLSPEELEDIRG
jgi:hypothetical protein